MKRVVTGHGPDGKAVFVSIGAPPRTVTSQNGGQVTYCWGTAGPPVVPAGGGTIRPWAWRRTFPRGVAPAASSSSFRETFTGTCI
jgi:hypothetical protein